jgi:hypothetical protein
MDRTHLSINNPELNLTAALVAYRHSEWTTIRECRVRNRRAHTTMLEDEVDLESLTLGQPMSQPLA